MPLLSKENARYWMRIQNIGPLIYSENPSRRKVLVAAREAWADNLLHEVAKAEGKVRFREIVDYPMGGMWHQNLLTSATGNLKLNDLMLDFQSQRIYWRIGDHREGYYFSHDPIANAIPCILLKDTNGMWVGVRCIEILRSVYGAVPFVNQYLFDFQGDPEPSEFKNPYIYSAFQVLDDGGVLIDVLDKVRKETHLQEIGAFLSNDDIRTELIRLSAEYHQSTEHEIWPTVYFPFRETGKLVAVGQKYERCLMQYKDASMEFVEVYGIASVLKYQFPIFNCPYVKARRVQSPKPYGKLNEDRLPSSQEREVGTEQSVNWFTSIFDGVSLPRPIIETTVYDGKRQTIEYGKRSSLREKAINLSDDTLPQTHREKTEFYVPRNRFTLPHIFEGMGGAEGREIVQGTFDLRDSFYYLEEALRHLDYTIYSLKGRLLSGEQRWPIYEFSQNVERRKFKDRARKAFSVRVEDEDTVSFLVDLERINKSDKFPVFFIMFPREVFETLESFDGGVFIESLVHSRLRNTSWPNIHSHNGLFVTHDFKHIESEDKANNFANRIKEKYPQLKDHLKTIIGFDG